MAFILAKLDHFNGRDSNLSENMTSKCTTELEQALTDLQMTHALIDTRQQAGLDIPAKWWDLYEVKRKRCQFLATAELRARIEALGTNVLKSSAF